MYEMTTEDICKKAFAEALNVNKRLRDADAEEDFEKKLRIVKENEFFNIGDEEYSHYRFLVEESEKTAYAALSNIIMQMLRERNIQAFKIPLSIKQVMIAVMEEPPYLTMYVFKEYGIPQHELQQIAEKTVSKLQEKHVGIRDMRFICLVEDNAYSAIFNHNNDALDPTRGTGLYSLKWFFMKYFSFEDFEEFKKQAMNYKKEINQYMGMSVVKTLTPNTLFSFRRTMKYIIANFKFEECVTERYISNGISDQQYKVIMEQFKSQNYYKAMLGHNDFSESLLTAEWLYESLKKAGKIDYTSVALGYFKAIEQLLYGYISFHKNEGRTIKKKHGEGYLVFDDANLNLDLLDTTLGTLNSFLSYYKNTDLFRTEIKAETISFIKNKFHAVKELRNGYFHKDNLDEWEKVEEARENAFIVCFFMLGAYKYNDLDKQAFSIPIGIENNDFYKLCEYTNYHVRDVYYISEGKEEGVYLCSRDSFVTYNEYGDPSYSGIYFRKLDWITNNKYLVVSMSDFKQQHINPGTLVAFDENTIKKIKISVGKIVPVHDGVEFTGPKVLICNQGRFCAPDDLDKPEF